MNIVTKPAHVKVFSSQFLRESRTWGQGDLAQTLREIAMLSTLSFATTITRRDI